jgi:hypothetical protein
LLLLSVAMLIAASFAGTILIDGLDTRNLQLAFLTSLLAVMFYACVLAVTGFARRILQALTSIIGCGAILTILAIAEFVMFRPFVGQAFAGLVAVLIGLWSVPVEGHIISRAIGQHWFAGIAIAVAATVLQFVFQAMFAGPLPDTE